MTGTRDDSLDLLEHIIPLTRDPTHIVNDFFQILFRGSVFRPRGAHHLFLNHDTPHIVGPITQGQLTKLEADGQPRGLDVLYVVEKDAGERDHPQIFLRA